MPTVTVQVSDDLKKRMDQHEITNWSAVARAAFEKQLSDLEFFKEFSKHSTMTEAEAIRLGRQVSQKIGEHYRQLYGLEKGKNMKKK